MVRYSYLFVVVTFIGIDCIEMYGPRRLSNGYWVEEEGKNTKLFFDNLAKRKGMQNFHAQFTYDSTGKDPLIPETWYKVTYKDVIQANVCRSNI